MSKARTLANFISQALVDSDEVAANAISSDKILASAVITSKLADGAVTLAKIGTNAVDSDRILANSITNAKIADNAIDSDTILNSSITSAKIANNAVGITQLNVADGTVNQVLTTDGAGTLSFSTAGAQGGDSDQVFWENDQIVRSSYSITAGQNAMTVGPVTIQDGATVTVPDSSRWVVI